MPIYLYWGNDDYAIQRAVQGLRDRTLDPDWASFNYDKIAPDQPDGIAQALNQAVTAPFGMGKRLVWLENTTLGQRCPEELLVDLQRTLPHLPHTTVLLLTMGNKPDGRLKSTKLLQKHAEIQEFSLIPPWKADLLERQVKQVAQELGVKLTAEAVELLVEAVGNNTRQLYNEIEKLKLYGNEAGKPLGKEAIASLVTTSTQSSVQLARAIRMGDTARALTLLDDLFKQNESPLRMVATLVGQFRTWLWVKLMVDAGERDDKAIAQAAEVSNPKRIYFLKQEVKSLPLAKLQQVLPLLLELEYGLKQGAEEVSFCQTKVIELCRLLGN
jgi:DNA polymerase-3 subunit delta